MRHWSDKKRTRITPAYGIALVQFEVEVIAAIPPLLELTKAQVVDGAVVVKAENQRTKIRST